MPVSVQEAVRRFESAGFERSDRYKVGTEGKGTAWNNSKSRAKTNFAPAMAAALQEDAYGKGLDKADGADYDRGIRDKGITNWGTGMQAGGTKYSSNITPFVPLWNQDLATARGPKRSANNIKRMTENVQRFTAAAGKK